MVTDTTPKGPESLRVMRGLVFLLAALLLIAALYYYFVPVQVASKEGVFGCGTAANPPSADKDGFQFGACQKTAVINQFRTYALLGGAAASALAAFLLFRTPRTDDWEDDIDLADRDRGDARRGDARRGDRAGRPEAVETSRGLRGARREEPSRREEASYRDESTSREEPVRRVAADAPAETRQATDDWDAAVDEPRSRAPRRDDDFLDDEDAPRRSRRRSDDDF